MKKYCFINPNVINSQNGDVKLTVCEPSEIRVAFKCSEPWEQWLPLYTSFIYDEERKEFRIYYMAKDKNKRDRLALAVSQDGLNWVKPNLGLYEFNGTRNNNILCLPAGDGGVIYDKHALPSERYKYFVHNNTKGLHLFCSEDGINWDIDKKILLCEMFLDGHNTAFYDKYNNKYRYYIRGWDFDEAKDLAKRIALYGECEDLKTEWNLKEPLCKRNPNEQPIADREHFKCVMSADEFDNEDTDVYTLPVSVYPGDSEYYVAFSSFYHHVDLGRENDGFVESHLCGSHDGINWYRYDRRPYIRNLLNGEYKCNMSYIGTGIHIYNDMMYSCGLLYQYRHGEPDKRLNYGDGCVMLYGQRIDGYVCAEFGVTGGKITVNIDKSGTKLYLNLDTGTCGMLHLTVKSTEKTVEYDISVNSIKYQIDLPNELQGKPIELTFEGKQSRLFAVEVD